jgi:putative transposase
MRTSARTRYAGYRFPAEIIGHAAWRYFRFPLGLRMAEELLAARGIIVSHEPSDSQIPRLALVCLVAVLIAL